MTPRVQQGFSTPSVVAGGISTAATRGMGGDALTDMAVALDGSGQDFMKMVQDAVGQTPDAKMDTVPSVAQPAELGSKAAAAMLLQVVTKAETLNLAVSDENLAIVPPDQNKDTDLDLSADAASGTALPLPIRVPLVLGGQKVDAHHGLYSAVVEQEIIKGQMLMAPVENLFVGAAPQVDQRFDAKAATVLGQALPFPLIADLTQSIVPQGFVRNASISDLSQAIPTDTAGIALPLPASVLATLPVTTINPDQLASNIATAVQKNTEKFANAPTLPPGETTTLVAAAPETHANPTHTSPAETMFRLRTAGGEINRPDVSPIGPPQMSDSKTPKSLPSGRENAAHILAGEPAASIETVVLPVVDLGVDLLPSTSPFSTPDSIKPTAFVLAQPSATASSTVVLPPQVPADLVNLAKTLPTGPVEILLNPQELGQLRFEIHQNADQLRVVLSVERPETMDLLRRHADQLLAEFRAAGFSGASLSFGQWNHQNSDPRAHLTPPPPAQDRENDPPPPRTPLHSALELAASTGLNIRL